MIDRVNVGSAAGHRRPRHPPSVVRIPTPVRAPVVPGLHRQLCEPPASAPSLGEGDRRSPVSVPRYTPARLGRPPSSPPQPCQRSWRRGRCPRRPHGPAAWHLRPCGVNASDLPRHGRMRPRQQPVAGLIAHVVLRPGIYVVHVHFVAGQRRHRAHELPALVEHEQAGTLLTRVPPAVPQSLRSAG